MQNKKGMHYFISGKVQGVWFRVSTQQTAASLGITGWVKNLSDGRVEAAAFGDAEKLAELSEWLKQGPPGARVSEVVADEISWENHERFAVR